MGDLHQVGEAMGGKARQTAVIIGAGPAGLTAAYELLERTDVKPVVVETLDRVGGIAMTVEHNGNRMDLGGHRFFSKHDRVMEWWLNLFPLAEGDPEGRPTVGSGDTCRGDEDRVMLLRSRLSRIYYLRKFFSYPISLSADTLLKLGPWKTLRIMFSYLKSALFPVRDERNLEQFFINRFGNNLYRTFFKSYTEKLWGVPCDEISADWGAQRIKGLSIYKTLEHAFSRLFSRTSGISQKSTETSLIERFLYPKYGPGQMWDEVARRVVARGGEIVTGHEVAEVHAEGDRVLKVVARDVETGSERTFEGCWFFSTMPVKDLVEALRPAVPERVAGIGGGLMYRDFIAVGLLLDKLRIADGKRDTGELVKDNWIYIQEPDVLVGRMQIFNNWSPYLVADPELVWLGMEYFCFEGDELWRRSDAELLVLAAGELEKMGMVGRGDVLDGNVVRVLKAYPAYFGTYDRFGEVVDYFERFGNLFLIGRNGMHRYNNMDHAMLTAMTAVDNLVEGRTDKSNIWSVNVEEDYHETA